MNHKAIDAGRHRLHDGRRPRQLGQRRRRRASPCELTGRGPVVKMVKEILDPVGKMDGDSLPVSAFMAHADGTFELGASAYEKRGVAVSVPEWDSRQVHPVQPVRLRLPPRHHPSLRPHRRGGQAAAPAAAKIVAVKAGKGKGVYKFAMAVSPLDCMGCGVCAGVCPGQGPDHGSAWRASCRSRKSSTTWSSKVSEKEDMAGHHRARAASSSSPCWSSPAPAPAAPRPATPA